MKNQIIVTSDQGGFYDSAKEDASGFAGRICRISYENSPFVRVDQENAHFRGDRTFSLHGLPDGYNLVAGSDGIGTKVILADAIRHYMTMACDLIAMSADDQARNGHLPLVYTNVMDVSTVESREQFEAFKELLTGLAMVAKQQNIVLLSGETAQLGTCVGTPNPDANLAFNWSGSMLGVSHENLKIDGNNVKVGDVVVAFKQDGFRSNGISKVRKAFEKRYGLNWYKDAPKGEIGDALEPSVPYSRVISEANGWFNKGNRIVPMNGIAHLSGGSFKSKFFEALLQGKNLSADLDNLYKVPEITRKCTEWLLQSGENLTPEIAYTTWCCGQGMLVVLPDLESAEQLIKIAKQFGVEAQVAGKITETPKGKQPQLNIESKF